MKINLKELEKEKQKNFEERLAFVELWANYVKTHPDEVWSEQQKMLIDSQYS